MTINVNDIDRLCAEILNHAPDEGTEWSDKEGIELDAIVALRETAYNGIIEKAQPGQGLDTIIKDCIATTFMMGWEAHKQYGTVRT